MFNKISKFIKTNKLGITISIAVFLFFCINYYELDRRLSKITYENKFLLIFVILSIVLSILAFLLYKKTEKVKETNLPQYFVFLATILGGVFIILSPLFSGSDEHNHFYRIYEISENIIVTPTNKVVGSKLPTSLYKTFIKGSGLNSVKYRNIDNMSKITLKEEKKIQYGKIWSTQYANTALYSPIQYTPQVIGFILGKLLHLNPYFIGMIGRLFNLLVYILLGYMCIKTIPKAKLFYFIVLLSPNMLQCATTLSADAFTNAIFLLFIALIFKIIYKKDKISKGQEVSLLVLSIVIALCKIVYLPIVALLLLIPKERFERDKLEKVLFVCLTVLLASILSLVWIRTTNGVFDIAYDKYALQKEFVLSNIFEYFIIFIRTFMNYGAKFIECLFVGTTMYHSQLKMPAIISYAYVIIVIIALLQSESKKILKGYGKLLIIIIGVLITGLISTAIYLQCTAQYFSVSNLTIEGIQGRYFIPIIMLLPFIIDHKSIKVNNSILYKIVISINLVTWIYMINVFMI